MILISHRGNLTGENPKYENDPSYIREAIQAGYKVEIDVWWYRDRWFLGHNKPTYPLKNVELILSCWCHAKNREALKELSHTNPHPHFFWHESDSYTITSHGYIWTHVGKPIIPSGICVLPEKYEILSIDEVKKCAGICSDRIADYNSI